MLLDGGVKALLTEPLQQQSAERCVSTLLDLIQTKVNYVVQEAIVVIKDIFRKYPNKYVGRGQGWAACCAPRAGRHGVGCLEWRWSRDSN